MDLPSLTIRVVRPLPRQPPTYFRCMLAYPYAKYRALVVAALDLGKAVFVQPKLDGIRCLGTAAMMMSRLGNQIDSVDALRAHIPTGVRLDGELYAPQFAADFEGLMGQFQSAGTGLQYHVFDLPSHPGNFAERYAALVQLVAQINCPDIVLVPTLQVRTVAELDAAFAAYLEQGFEGQIIRLNDTYRSGRTTRLLKRKELQDAEFPVVGVNDLGSLVLRLPEGQTFTVPCPHLRDWLLAHPQRALSQQATVRFSSRTKSGLPRHAAVRCLRNYE